MNKPAASKLFDLARCVYQKCPPNLNGSEKLFQNATIAVYVNHEKQILILTFRGTTELKDWTESNRRLPLGNLTQSPRYASDLRIAKQFVEQYPTYKVYLTGHSLGGAIAQQVLRDLNGEGAMVFNSAYQPQDWKNLNTNVKKYHIEGDPLLNMIPKQHKSRITKLSNRGYKLRQIGSLAAGIVSPIVPLIAKSANSLDAHKLAKFEIHRSSLTW